MIPLLQIWCHSLLQYSILNWIFQCSNGNSVQNSNVDWIVVWLHATGTWEFGLNLHKLINRQMSHIVFSHHFVLHVLLFQPYDNTKRERDILVHWKGTKILLAEEKVEKMSLTHFMQIGELFQILTCLSHEWNQHSSFESSRCLNISKHSIQEWNIEPKNEIKFAIMESLIHPWQERLRCFDCNLVQNKAKSEIKIVNKNKMSHVCFKMILLLSARTFILNTWSKGFYFALMKD